MILVYLYDLIIHASYSSGFAISLVQKHSALRPLHHWLYLSSSTTQLKCNSSWPPNLDRVFYPQSNSLSQESVLLFLYYVKSEISFVFCLLPAHSIPEHIGCTDCTLACHLHCILRYIDQFLELPHNSCQIFSLQLKIQMCSRKAKYGEDPEASYLLQIIF